MKVIALLLCVMIFSGCTHTGVSDRNMLSARTTHQSIGDPQDFPLNIEAMMQCHTYTAGATMGGVIKETNCSNKGRILAVDKIFRERGLEIVPANDSAAPTISITTKKMNGFLEGTTGFFNLMTLGVLPMYSYKDYIVSYKSQKDDISISKKVRISSTTSWFSLLASNPDGLNEKEIERRVEENLIRSVLDEAKIY